MTGMECLPEQITGQVFYRPGQNPQEEKYKALLEQLWEDKYRTD